MTRVVFINLVVMLSVFVSGDLILGYFLNDSVAYMCRDTRVHHKYCPGVTRTYKMNRKDGGKTINSHWNQSSVRVYDKSQKSGYTDFSKYKHVLIGDSFVAQRQVETDETISNLLNLRLGSIDFVQYGTGSWNFLTYYEAIRTIEPSRGQHVHIFLMANDFYSYYGLSTSSYSKKVNFDDDIKWPRRTENFLTYITRFVSNNSFTYQTLKYKMTKELKYRKILKLPVVSEPTVNSDCGVLKQYFKKFGKTRLYSLVEQSFDKNCFSSRALENLEYARKISKKLKTFSKKMGFKLSYYLVPNGTFSEQEVEGFKRSHGVDGKSVLTSEGIRIALESSIGEKIHSFEKYLIEIKRARGLDKVYYSYDGHWNSTGSKLIADFLFEKEYSRLLD